MRHNHIMPITPCQLPHAYSAHSKLYMVSCYCNTNLKSSWTSGSVLTTHLCKYIFLKVKSPLKMASQLAIFLCLSFVVVSLALPSDSEDRLKRDVMDSVKNAWTDAVKSVSEAGDAVVDAVKPTEKSAVDKLADGVKSLGE